MSLARLHFCAVIAAYWLSLPWAKRFKPWRSEWTNRWLLNSQFTVHIVSKQIARALYLPSLIPVSSCGEGGLSSPGRGRFRTLSSEFNASGSDFFSTLELSANPTILISKTGGSEGGSDSPVDNNAGCGGSLIFTRQETKADWFPVKITQCHIAAYKSQSPLIFIPSRVKHIDY